MTKSGTKPSIVLLIFKHFGYRGQAAKDYLKHIIQEIKECSKIYNWWRRHVLTVLQKRNSRVNIQKPSKRSNGKVEDLCLIEISGILYTNTCSLLSSNFYACYSDVCEKIKQSVSLSTDCPSIHVCRRYHSTEGLTHLEKQLYNGLAWNLPKYSQHRWDKTKPQTMTTRIETTVFHQERWETTQSWKREGSEKLYLQKWSNTVLKYQDWAFSLFCIDWCWQVHGCQ